MRKGIANPEKNNGKRLTIPARTRSPLDAFKMFEAGQNIDLVAGYWEQEGYVEPDFYMMDHIGKLQALNRYRTMKIEKEKEMKQYKEDHEKVIASLKSKQEAEALEKRIQEEVQRRLSNNSNTINNDTASQSS